MLNDANNHSFDFGAAGQAQTVRSIHAAGLAQTGLPGEITRVKAGRVTVAFVAFAPYPYTANLLDLPAARALIKQARRQAQLVVVYMHAGAEGAAADHVTGREETYLGEDRGNPEAFAHMAIDAGASLVIASGPHVLRGLQFYQGHLIAYSLGNFAGYSNFSVHGTMTMSAILRVTLSSSGRFSRAACTPSSSAASAVPPAAAVPSPSSGSCPPPTSAAPPPASRPPASSARRADAHGRARPDRERSRRMQTRGQRSRPSAISCSRIARSPGVSSSSARTRNPHRW